MFISYAEKKHLLDQAKLISGLIKDMSLALTEITMLKAKVKVLEAKAKVVVPKKVKTPEEKAKQAEYMRRYTARKRAEKKAQLAQAVA